MHILHAKYYFEHMRIACRSLNEAHAGRRVLVQLHDMLDERTSLLSKQHVKVQSFEYSLTGCLLLAHGEPLLELFTHVRHLKHHERVDYDLILRLNC